MTDSPAAHPDIVLGLNPLRDVKTTSSRALVESFTRGPWVLETSWPAALGRAEAAPDTDRTESVWLRANYRPECYGYGPDRRNAVFELRRVNWMPGKPFQVFGREFRGDMHQDYLVCLHEFLAFLDKFPTEATARATYNALRVG